MRDSVSGPKASEARKVWDTPRVSLIHASGAEFTSALADDGPDTS
jgi:hypothetical protein